MDRYLIELGMNLQRQRSGGEPGVRAAAEPSPTVEGGAAGAADATSRATDGAQTALAIINAVGGLAESLGAPRASPSVAKVSPVRARAELDTALGDNDARI